MAHHKTTTSDCARKFSHTRYATWKKKRSRCVNGPQFYQNLFTKINFFTKRLGFFYQSFGKKVLVNFGKRILVKVFWFKILVKRFLPKFGKKILINFGKKVLVKRFW